MKESSHRASPVCESRGVETLFRTPTRRSIATDCIAQVTFGYESKPKPSRITITSRPACTRNVRAEGSRQPSAASEQSADDRDVEAAHALEEHRPIGLHDQGRQTTRVAFLASRTIRPARSIRDSIARKDSGIAWSPPLGETRLIITAVPRRFKQLWRGHSRAPGDRSVPGLVIRNLS
jgi:hypothetical protein